MAKSKVAILKTSPATVLRDYHDVMNLGGYQDVVGRNADTALKVNISWHFFFPGSSTTPWQLDGVIKAMMQDGYDPNLIHACPNRTVVIHLPTVKTHIFTTMTGAMKNAFGGLLNEHRHWTHPVIHETLVDLLMIQKKIHRGIFAVMDGTFAGDGPGPRCMIPYTKNVILASADQVAIDAVAAKLMGFDPMAIKFIRMAHELGLGCGDPRDIEIVGDTEAGKESWHFVGPFKRMTFASRMQHKIYWGPMKKPIEWSLKTVLAPSAYIASVIYHDSFWYAFNAKRMMRNVLAGPWGRLFRNWETLTPDANGFPQIGDDTAQLNLTGRKALVRSLGILGPCITQAPEFLTRPARQARGRA